MEIDLQGGQSPIWTVQPVETESHTENISIFSIIHANWSSNKGKWKDFLW
jgi:hypothetical protein